MADQRVREVDWPPYSIYDNQPAARSWVYEIWDTNNRLAYVGTTDNFERRWKQHLDKSWWLNEITVGRIYVFGYRTRAEARQVEAAAINETPPVYNTNLETRWYQRYLELWSNPERPTDEYDCTPVKKRYFRREERHGEDANAQARSENVREGR